MIISWLDALQLAPPAQKLLTMAWQELAFEGYQRIGSVKLCSESGEDWHVKVRWSGKRRHFLRVEHNGGGEVVVCAGHKPEKYAQCSVDEWKMLALLVLAEKKHVVVPELRQRAIAILRQLGERGC